MHRFLILSALLAFTGPAHSTVSALNSALWSAVDGGSPSGGDPIQQQTYIPATTFTDPSTDFALPEAQPGDHEYAHMPT